MNRRSPWGSPGGCGAAVAALPVSAAGDAVAQHWMRKIASAWPKAVHRVLGEARRVGSCGQSLGNALADRWK